MVPSLFFKENMMANSKSGSVIYIDEAGEVFALNESTGPRKCLIWSNMANAGDDLVIYDRDDSKYGAAKCKTHFILKTQTKDPVVVPLFNKPLQGLFVKTISSGVVTIY